ncbi:ribonuclease H-like domain-containing protein [Tanacetum coccineum]
MGLNNPIGTGFRVDDIVLIASSPAFLHQVIASLYVEFPMTYFAALNYFLGILMTRYTSGMFLSQTKYATKVIECANMVLVEMDSKLVVDGDTISHPTIYHSLVGALQYLTFTRPDISYDVHQACLFMHDPRELHFSTLKRILCYIRGTLYYGLQLYSSSTSSLVACLDADLASGITTHRRFNIHLVRDLVATGHICVLHVSSRYQYCDIFCNISYFQVMVASTIPVSAEENLGDPIDIRVDIIHLEPVAAVAFPATAIVRTQAQHGEAIRGIQEHLLGVPIQEELTALRFRADIAEAENASLRARIKTMEAIKKITRNRKRHARVRIEQQLAAVQESQRQDREDFRKLKELVTSQLGQHS